MQSNRNLVSLVAIAAAIAICCAIVQVQAAIVNVPISQGGWTLTFKSYYYDQCKDQTVFFYELITTTQVAQRLVVKPNCATPSTSFTVRNSNFRAYTASDSLSKKPGFPSKSGQPIASTVTYALILAGKQGSSMGEAYVFGTNGWLATQALRVPDCAAATNFPVLSPQPESVKIVKCDDAEAALLPGEVKIDAVGACADEYDLNRRVSQTNGDFTTLCMYVLKVRDNDKPYADPIETNIEIECGVDELPEFDQVVAYDNCTDDVSVQFCDDSRNGTCPGEIFHRRTWTLTDDCGNAACITQTITQFDSIPPELEGVPEDEEVQCTSSSTAIPQATVTASDACGIDSDQPVLEEETIPGDCSYTFQHVRTWTATDQCGHETSATSTFVVYDHVAPVLTLSPNKTSYTVECSDDLPEIVPSATDVCDDNLPDVNYTETTIPGNCSAEYTLRRKYFVEDECMNYVQTVVTIHVVDTTDPVLDPSSIPNDEGECDDIPAPVDVCASDNCGPTDLSYTQEKVPFGECANEFDLIRTYIASDDCGHSASVSYTVQIRDNTDPFDVEAPEDYSSQCGPIPDPETLPPCEEPTNLALGSCYECYALSHVDVPQNTPRCELDQLIHRVYTWTDCAGNTYEDTQIIQVNDTIAPTLIGVPVNDDSVYCDDLPSYVYPQVTADDNCDTDVPVITDDDTTPGDCDANYTITYTYSAEDDCGNDVSDTWSLTVYDNVDPYWVNFPEDDNATCVEVDDEIPQPTADDDCSSVLVTKESDTIEPNGCTGNYTRVVVWRATDSCGNFIERTFRRVVRDNDAPQVDDPEDGTADCGDVVIPPDVCAADDCGDVSLAFSRTKINQDAICQDRYTWLHTWTATDDCGHQTVVTQEVDVDDTTNPVFNPATPTNTSYECDEFQYDDPTASDDCANQVLLTPSENRVDGTCDDEYRIDRSIKADDYCGNIAWFNYSISVYDNTDPTLQGVPDNDTFECGSVLIPTPQVTAFDNCDPSPNVTRESDEYNRTCNGNYTVVVAYTAVDRCGNDVTELVYFEVRDTTAPEWTSTLPPNEISNECILPNGLNLLAEDDCSGVLTAVPEDTLLTPDAPLHCRDYNRHWEVEDDCGHVLEFDQLIHVFDQSIPELGADSEDDLDCEDSIPAFVPYTVTDNCGEDLQVTADDDEVPSNVCDANYDVVRTVSVEDDCGNSDSLTITFHITDQTPPVLPPIPTKLNYSCEESIPDNVLTLTPDRVSDDCSNFTLINETTITPGDCPQAYTIHVRWVARDSCGNEDAWEFDIDVYDVTPPNVIGWENNAQYLPEVNIDTSDSCDFPEPLTPIWNDNCDVDLTETATNVTVPTDCPLAPFRVYTWNATDDCGNSDSIQQVVNFIHVTNPTFEGDTTVISTQCIHAPRSENITAFDVCGNELDVEEDEDRDNGDCPYRYNLTFIWNTADSCNLPATLTEPRYVDDNFPPVLNVPNGGLWELYRDQDCVEPEPLNLTAQDQCSGARPVSVTTSRIPTDCIYVYTLTYTYFTEDECGNSDSKDQVYDVVPANSAYFETLPGPFSAPCDDVPDQVDINAFGPCGEELPVNKSEEVIPGDCPNEYTLVRTWKAVDACGNEIEHEQLVTVFDSAYPVLSPLPPHESVQCGFLPPIPRVYATDNCPGVNLTLTQVYVNNTEGHCCDFELHRTWTAKDACNKTTTYTQIITVSDTIPPVLNIPGDESFECVPPDDYKTVYEAYHPPLAVASCVAGSTNTAAGCDAVSSIVRGTEEFNFVAGESYWISYTHDGALLVANVTRVDDNGAYVLTLFLEQRALLSDGVATPLIGSCLQDVNPGDWFFYMKASGNLTSTTALPAFINLGREISGEAGAQVGAGASQVSNGLGGSATLTFQEEDMVFATVITFDYRPENEDDCDVSSLTLPALECGDNVTVTVDEERINGSCPYDYVLNLTYHYMDNNWNMVSKSRLVTIFDDNFPVLDEVDDKIIACNSTFVDLPTPGATDECDPNVTVTLTNRTVTEGDCPQEYRVDYVWTAVDDCENEDTTSAFIQVIDEYSPWFINFPSGYSQECSDPAPEHIEVEAADNCDDDVDVEVTNSTTPGSCPQEYSITFSYLAEDDCGHNRTNSYTVVVEDTTDPILTLGPNLEFSCEETATIPTASCSDNCDTNILPTHTDSFSGDECEGVTTYVFTCADDCANDVSDSRTVTVHDRKNPVWDLPLPSDETVYCADYEEQGDLTATDNCGEVTVTKNFTLQPGSCSSRFVEVRNWYACDECDNCISHTVRYTVIDNTGPVLDDVDSPVNYECHEIGVPPDVCASDECTNTTLSYSESDDQDDECDRYTITRVWNAVDDCGNPNSVTQIVIVTDTNAPTFDSEPPSQPIIKDCKDGDHLLDPDASDLCSNVTIVLTNVTNSLCGPTSSARSINYVYTATDACGQFATFPYTVNFLDTTDPVVNGPADVNEYCLDEDNLPIGSITYSDDCDTDPDVSGPNGGLTSRSSTCPKNFTYTFTWTVTDACDNDNSVSQQITSYDNVAPSWNDLPANETLDCGDWDNYTAPTLTCHDDCFEQDFTAQVVGVVNTGSSCDRYKTISYECADGCGHTITHTHYARFIDNTDPVLSCSSSKSVYECTETIPPLSCSASDDCQSNLEVDTLPIESVECPDSVYNITYESFVDDGCGNTASSVVVISIVDSFPPTLVSGPDDEDVECDPSQPDPVIDDPIFEDSCDSNFTVTPSENTVNDGCPGNETITYCWTPEDCAGNVGQQYCVDLVRRDRTPPSIDDVPDEDYECTQFPQFPANPSASDICDPNVAVTRSDGIPQGDVCLRTQEFTFTATDDCGHTATSSVTYTYTDTEDPYWTSPLPQNDTVDCSDIPEVVLPTAADDCSGATVDYNETSVPLGTCEADRVIIRTFFAYDGCGHSIFHVQYITVLDTTAPELDEAPADETVECTPPIPADICTSDDCSTVSLSYSQVKEDGDCLYNYTLTRTWTAVDECGNNATDSQVITVFDGTAPVFNEDLPAGETYECEEPDVPVLTADDNCEGVVSVNRTIVPSQGDCPANYTWDVTWYAVDDCENFVEHTATYISQDSVPPSIDGETVCFEKCENVAGGCEYHEFHNPTGQGVFFNYGDNCSTVSLTLTGCSSNQDVAFEVTGYGSTAFTTDCYYCPTTDILYVWSDNLPSGVDANGRVWTLTAEVEDACGHVSTASAQIWLPSSPNSVLPDGTTPADLNCVPALHEPVCPIASP